MIQYTEQLTKNIDNMKKVPGILDVQVSEPEDFITQQTVVDCLKFTLTGAHGIMELYVPEDLCMNQVADINDNMIEEWTLPLKEGYVKEYSFETVARRFIDVEHQNFNHLDGGIPITQLNENQIKLVEDLVAIDGIGQVTLKTVVDPYLKQLANCSNPILVCCTPEDTSKGILYKVLVPEVSHDDTTTFDTVVDNIKNLI